MEQNIEEIHQNLLKFGCCHVCTTRHLTKPSSVDVNKLIAASSLDHENPKRHKSNPCIACLGLFQNPQKDQIINEIISYLKLANYDSDTFNIAFNLPMCTILRGHSISLYVSKTRISFNPLAPTAFVCVKDAWKLMAEDAIVKATGKRFDVHSPLLITATFSYENDKQECDQLNTIIRLSNKNLQEILTQMDNKDFVSQYGDLPSIPSSTIIFKGVSSRHESVHIAGRYNKWSRTLSQTPWIVDQERRLESSVEEIISEPIKKHTLVDSFRFSSSGREDIDVRMLGKGRPFALELVNPKKTKFSFETFREIENDINKNSLVRVKHLQSVTKDDLKQLKSGEEFKIKFYRALCYAKGELPDLDKLNKYTSVDLVQNTPIRVLHRRANMARNRTIHSINGSAVKVDGNSDCSFFNVVLSTQAGTYIKEFVHGDLGRTTPSLRTILENDTIDILALDVLSIEIDWPMSVKY
ncbi:tRNA pseudouridine synthase Pus10 [Adelges cooleyi]|uniref:tRNA pseudouridine synthase Pus10 n=1 Tax=Adelges cooleyi TaxID=133065 RepID=UPI00217F95BF|nr:tRNA pseudouridine synthase Pus10 [Adelges cooleyi]XP_050432394.1 tRNA pseudouridine synthase Pus10 [Adelges cooleyi]XP_050432395.1 tRNA pseudouridine synthase Pus10 [Adelges cooleyi]